MKKLIFFGLMIIFLFSFSACQGESYTDFFLAMDTYMEFTAYGEGAEEAVDLIVEDVESLDSMLSVTDPESEIYSINSTSGEPRPVSPITKNLLEAALDICRRTEGAADITVYPLIKAWGFTDPDEAYRVPEEGELEELLEKVDYKRVELKENTLTMPRGFMIDLGSVAKGFSGDLAAARLRSLGIDNAILSLGGNIHCVGGKPGGGYFSIGVQDPRERGKYLGVLKVKDQAVVTSGGYERYFESEGEVFWHILDPKTGYPSKNDIVSVTVISDSGVLADGLSTGLFVMGLEKAMEHYAQSDDFEAVIVTADSRVYVSPGIARKFTLKDSENYTMWKWES